MSNKKLIINVFVICILLCENKGFAMSMLFPSKVVPFSGFEGQILEKGKPVANAKSAANLQF